MLNIDINVWLSFLYKYFTVENKIDTNFSGTSIKSIIIIDDVHFLFGILHYGGFLALD